MARRRTVLGTVKVTMAHIRVEAGFNGMRRGDEAVVELDARVQGWVNAGLVKVLDWADSEVELVDGGEDQAGPGGAEPDAPGSEPDGG